MATATQIAPAHKRHDKGLILIAAYKLLIALIFAAFGVGALRLIGKDVGDVVSDLVAALHFDPESRFVNFLLDKASLLNDPILRRIGFATFSYSVLCIVEAVGLYLEKAWAEWLTILVTASFLPLEIRELAIRFTWLRVSIFVINVLVLLYLLVVVLERQRQKHRERVGAKAVEEE